MPVTFNVAPHSAKPTFDPSASSSDEIAGEDYREGFLKNACYKQWKESGEILQTSLSKELSATLIPRRNGFVQTVVDAYGSHHHLTIRPDDVWIAILGQLSFYVNAHAEDLRNYFVAHEGQKTLKVTMAGTRYTVDFGDFARQMTQNIHDHVVDKTLVEWILPDYSTSNVHDTTICSILLMSTLQSYEFRIICGLPSVTLEGKKADWEQLYRRLDRLPELGDEPSQWAEMLRPILRRFVDAFDGNPDLQFWNHVVNRNSFMCGQDLLSGWITAFCVWDSKGNWKGRSRPASAKAATTGSVMGKGRVSYHGPVYTLDGVPYFNLDMKDIPEGYCEVSVHLDDNGQLFDCKMVAGNVASRVSQRTHGGEYDTLSPAPQWFMYILAKTPRRGYEEEKEELLARLIREWDMENPVMPA